MIACFPRNKNFYLHKVDTCVARYFSICFSKISVQILVLSRNFYLHNSQNKFT